jgi:hypothetical protein
MTAMLLLLGVIAAVLTPLILRDLRRAAARRHRREAVIRFRGDAASFTAGLRAAAVATATAADRLREFRAAMSHGEHR